MRQLILVGNPNCGKTTLFNALTGAKQKVGNWPGVTVEKKTGYFQLGEEPIEMTDLPGIYSLSAPTKAGIDEYIAAEAIVNLPSDCIINIVDACHLERHLYLTSQLLELGKPMIVVLNMMDIAQQQGITIDHQALARQLHCPVIPLQAHKEIGLNTLLEAVQNLPKIAGSLPFDFPPLLRERLSLLQKQEQERGLTEPLSYYQALRTLESHPEFDLLIADARYTLIHQMVLAAQRKNCDASEHFTAKLDRIVLHRYLALPIFFAMMYLMFLFAVNIGGAFQDFFDISTDAIFVQGSAFILNYFHAPAWLIALIANGLGRGINTTLTFIPVIGAMFFFLSLLEASGYMARAAFVVDKAMRALGLPGKSFVPMIVGFGCNVPAIMAARTLDTERDRILTVLMSPFMSCSARLAIYAVFVAAFFPSGGQNVVFSLYLFGIAAAVLTGYLLRKTALTGKPAPLILELPAYHKPRFKRLFHETILRLRHFVVRAGRLIIPICVILGGLNALSIQGTLNTGEASAQSLLSLIGQWLTPLFAPMGLQPDNWPATVGLLTGMLAKEVVVGTLNTLYSQIGQVGQMVNDNFDLLAQLREALWSIPNNLAQLGQALINPIVASAPDNELSRGGYGVMVSQFDGAIGAYAYLLFVLLYIPCVSTMAVIRQETNRHWMWFSILWSLLLAYSAAVLCYQLGTFNLHPQDSLLWVVLMFGMLGMIFGFYHFKKDKSEAAYVT